MTAPKLSCEEFAKFRDLVYDTCGIFFADNKQYFLEARLSPRLEVHGLPSFSAYYRLITTRKQEKEALLDSITTHETSFFREMAQFQALKSNIFPELIARKQSSAKRIRIWSAACSSGEEPYTISMLVSEDPILSKAPWRVELIGTDLSETILERAQKGIYTEYALRNTSSLYRTKYFTVFGNEYHIKRQLFSRTRFARLNLCDSAKMKSMRGFDIVFCRNTLIYFNSESKTQVVENLYDSLVPGGYLFLSMTESLFGISNRFSTIRLAGGVLYRKQ
jgi:chemotaxis protein methyltransferase CheR